MGPEFIVGKNETYKSNMLSHFGFVTLQNIVIPLRPW